MKSARIILSLKDIYIVNTEGANIGISGGKELQGGLI